MVLPLWAGLGLALYLLHIPPEYRICVFGFNPRVPFCSGTNFKTWFMYLLVLITKAILYLGAVRYALPPGVIAIFMPVSYFLFKNRVQVIAGVRAHWKGTFNLWGRLLTLWIFVKCAWCAIDRNHKWYIWVGTLYAVLWSGAAASLCLWVGTGHEVVHWLRNHGGRFL